MSRPTSDAPIVSLRAALASTFPELRAVGLALVRDALTKAKAPGSKAHAAARLGVSRIALRRLRDDFPEVDE